MAVRAAHRCKNACLFLNRRLNRPCHFPQQIWQIQCGPGCVPTRAAFFRSLQSSHYGHWHNGISRTLHCGAALGVRQSITQRMELCEAALTEAGVFSAGEKWPKIEVASAPRCIARAGPLLAQLAVRL